MRSIRYDCAVIGSGPAGLEAALNLKIRKKSFLLFGDAALSRKIRVAPKIDNYLGLPSVTGAQMAEAFSAHLRDMQIQITHEMVSLVYPMGDYFSIATNHDTYEAATVILATGVFSAAFLKGEQELLGRGVGYCATCDAPLYRGKRVAIVGYTADSVQEANFVAELAEKVYFVPMGKFEISLSPSVEVVRGRPVAVLGEQKARGLALDGLTLEVDGVFFLRESVAPDTLVPGIDVEKGFISVNADMSTNIPGLFAAGDCTGTPHQYIRAAGQGLTAAFSAVRFIDSQKIIQIQEEKS